MKPQFTKSVLDITVNDSDIKKLENELNVKLPQQYKEFLLEGNYGDPEPKYFLTRYTGECIYFFSNIEKVISLTEQCWEEEEDIFKLPKTLIDIARTEAPSSILLGVGEDNYNKVYLLDYSEIEQSEELDEDEPEIWLVADSFDEFINSFCTEEEYMSSNTKLLDVVYYRVPK